MPRKLMLIIEAARGEKAEMCIRTGHAYRGQSERAIFTLVGVELVAPVLKLPLEMGVLSFVQNVDKELRNGGKASTCGIHAGI